jgi:hypothetical protein
MPLTINNFLRISYLQRENPITLFLTKRQSNLYTDFDYQLLWPSRRIRKHKRTFLKDLFILNNSLRYDEV